jgi:hypothetical protein
MHECCPPGRSDSPPLYPGNSLWDLGLKKATAQSVWSHPLSLTAAKLQIGLTSVLSVDRRLQFHSRLQFPWVGSILRLNEWEAVLTLSLVAPSATDDGRLLLLRSYVRPTTPVHSLVGPCCGWKCDALLPTGLHRWGVAFGRPKNSLAGVLVGGSLVGCFQPPFCFLSTPCSACPRSAGSRHRTITRPEGGSVPCARCCVARLSASLGRISAASRQKYAATARLLHILVSVCCF